VPKAGDVHLPRSAPLAVDMPRPTMQEQARASLRVQRHLPMLADRTIRRAAHIRREALLGARQSTAAVGLHVQRFHVT